MAEFNIDKGVPMPPKASGGKLGSGKYPWREMSPGDSFLVPEKKRRGAVARAANMIAPKIGATFATRLTPEGIRVWRVS